MNPYHYQDVFVHDDQRLIAGRRYLTNMPQDLMPLVEQALERSGRSDIHIDPDPIPSQHQSLNTGMFSIWVETECDCTDFWRAYEAVKQDPVWSTWLTLIRSP